MNSKKDTATQCLDEFPLDRFPAQNHLKQTFTVCGIFLVCGDARQVKLSHAIGHDLDPFLAPPVVIHVLLRVSICQRNKLILYYLFLSATFAEYGTQRVHRQQGAWPLLGLAPFVREEVTVHNTGTSLLPLTSVGGSFNTHDKALRD